MTTYSELKTALARDLRDPSLKTFSDAVLGDLINAGIMEVSRFAPQRFTEDISYVTDQLSYQLRSGTENSLLNPSFESGDATILAAYIELATGTSDELTGGWQVNDTLDAYFSLNASAPAGRRALLLRPQVGGVNRYVYQDVAVNPSTVYTVRGWHWRSGSGMTARLSVDTLDSGGSVVLSGVLTWDTDSTAPVYRTGSYTIPASGVASLRVKLTAVATGDASINARFDDIQVLESSVSELVNRQNSTLIELRRCEVWDTTLEPPRPVWVIQPASGEYVSGSDTGWEVWDGYLTIPYRHAASMTEGQHIIKVQGYCPYDRLTSDAQVTSLSDELEFAVRQFGRMEGIQRLVLDRDLFTQWQTRSGNTDVTPASLMNSYAVLADQWRRAKRELTVLREAP